MAKDDWRKKRAREDEKEQEFREQAQRKRGNPAQSPSAPNSGAPTQDLKAILDRVVPLIEQLNSLYNMYFSGSEKRPPIEKRAQLDQLIQQMTRLPKPSATLLFRMNSTLSQYRTYVEKWDRMLKDLESGRRSRG